MVHHKDKADVTQNYGSFHDIGTRDAPAIPLGMVAPGSAAYDNPALQTDIPPLNDTFAVDLDGDDADEKAHPAKPQSVAAPGTANDGAADSGLAAADDEADASGDFLTRYVLLTRSTLLWFYTTYRHPIPLVISFVLLLLYNVFLVAAIYVAVASGTGIHFCDGVGFLIFITALVYFGLFYYKVLKPLWRRLSKSARAEQFRNRVLKPMSALCGKIWSRRLVRLAAGLLVVSAIVLYLILDTAEERARIVSAFGAVVLIGLCWLFSQHPGKVIWRHVIWGIGLQITFGIIILRWDVGKDIFSCMGDKVNTFLGYTGAGSKFVFGFLVGGDQFVFAFSVLPVIIFFSFAIQILYYYGVMQVIIIKIGWLLQVTVGTTACESLNAAANIFVGQSEAPLLVKPYLSRLTMSELHAIMTGGFATIAGSVLAAYVSFGVSASHLLSASVMSAPAALAISKIVYPETQRSRTLIGDISIEKGDEVNALDAASRGAMSVVKICGYIAASLIAFIAAVAFVNGVLGWLGEMVGFSAAVGVPLSFEYLASLVFWPVAWLLGAPSAECGYIGELIAMKTILNEFVAYTRLQKMVADGVLSARSILIATYALCGFSNLGAMGIQISGLSAMAPDRRSDLARLAFSAMMAGNVACFLTACVAGALVSDPSSLNAAIAATVTQNITGLAQNATLLAENATLLAGDVTLLAQNATLLVGGI